MDQNHFEALVFTPLWFHTTFATGTVIREHRKQLKVRCSASVADREIETHWWKILHLTTQTTAPLHALQEANKDKSDKSKLRTYQLNTFQNETK